MVIVSTGWLVKKFVFGRTAGRTTYCPASSPEKITRPCALFVAKRSGTSESPAANASRR
jgi:hypothetical protein